MNMDTMQLNCNVIPLYLIKQTNSRLFHLCVDDKNNLLITFAKKTNFKEDFCLDFEIDFSTYVMHYDEVGENTVSVTNVAMLKKENLNTSILKYFIVLGELIYKTEVKRVDKLFELIEFIKSSDDENYMQYMITKMFLMIVYNHINFPSDFYLNERCLNIVKNNYDIIKSKVDSNEYKNLLRSLSSVLEDYGLEIFNIRYL